MDRREGWGGICVYISPVREKKHCGRRSEFAMSAFMPDAAVARQTAQRALRLGLPHGRPTSFTALGAHATATVGNDVLLAQCESIAQLRAAVRGRLDILRPRNGERVTLWVAKHVRGQGRGASTDFPKRRQLGVARSGDAVGVPGRGTWRVRKRDCHNEVVGARASALLDGL